MTDQPYVTLTPDLGQPDFRFLDVPYAVLTSDLGLADWQGVGDIYATLTPDLGLGAFRAIMQAVTGGWTGSAVTWYTSLAATADPLVLADGDCALAMISQGGTGGADPTFASTSTVVKLGTLYFALANVSSEFCYIYGAGTTTFPSGVSAEWAVVSGVQTPGDPVSYSNYQSANLPDGSTQDFPDSTPTGNMMMLSIISTGSTLSGDADPLGAQSTGASKEGGSTGFNWEYVNSLGFTLPIATAAIGVMGA